MEAQDRATSVIALRRDKVSPAGEEPVSQLADRQAIGRCSRRSACADVVFLPQAFQQRTLRITPRAELAELPADRPCPQPRGVGRIGKQAYGLSGLPADEYLLCLWEVADLLPRNVSQVVSTTDHQ
jgi:hypothetical protein